MKRYWSSHKPSGLTQEQSKEWDAFDAKLTPDDIIEMQTIDADCNDCIHFQRGKMIDSVPALYPELTKDGTIKTQKMFQGTCGMDGHPTHAYPGQYTGRDCFSHRRRQ